MKLAFKIVAVLFLLQGTLVLPASAGPAEDSEREHTKNANAAFNLGSYDEAATEYEAAYRAVPDPALLFNIGQAYRLAGKSSKALIAYKSYLRTAPASASNRAHVEARVRELETEAASKEGGPAAGSSQTDQPPIPVAPFPRPSGASEVDRARHSSPEELSASPGDRVSSARGIEPSSPQGLWLGRTWTWVAGGSAVLFAGTATIFGVAMRSQFDELNSKCGSASQTFPGCSASDFRSLDSRKNAANLFGAFRPPLSATLTAGVLLYIEGRPIRVAPPSVPSCSVFTVADRPLTQIRWPRSSPPSSIQRRPNHRPSPPSHQRWSL
jgi:tetratricopeptide (TPR) repeat protein